jgi:arylsulfatase A-like enzyme
MRFLAFVLAFVPCLATASGTPEPSRPNILLMMADDLGWSDLGCYGGEIRTPAIDALAEGGLRFTQFYNSARCCPTRASLLTGLYPHQAGVGSMTNDRGPQHPGYRGTLQPHTVTLAELLRPAGYHTSMVGKWHLHNKADIKPTDRGFDEFYGMLGGYNSCWVEDGSFRRLPADRPRRSYTSAVGSKPGSFYATDAFADYAIDFLSLARSAEKPFFLYLAFSAPHFPLHAHESDIAKYESLYFEKGWDRIREERLAKQKSLGLVPPGLALTPRSPVPPKSHAKPSPFAGKDNPAWHDLPENRRRDLARRMAVYAGMVDRMDQAIGRVTDHLRRTGQLENTLILFLSDNGACWEWDPFGFNGSSSPRNVLHEGEALRQLGQPEDYMSYGSGWANAGNTPWRLYKHFSHEGGIRSPFIVHWPAVIRDGRALRTPPAHLIDILPTLAAVSGATYPAQRHGIATLPPEGISILPAFRNEPLPRSTPLFFEHERSRAIREGDWKLVSLKDEAWELYHLADDPTESRNLIASQPEKAASLRTQWEQWAQRAHVDTAPEAPAPATPATPAEAVTIANRPLTISCDVETAASHGVILAQGGQYHGIALHLADGFPVFTVRIDGQPVSITGNARASGSFSLAAGLAADGAMTLSLNGVETARGRAPGLIPSQPTDPLSIGEDTRTAVGSYTAPHPLSGKVSRVSIR